MGNTNNSITGVNAGVIRGLKEKLGIWNQITAKPKPHQSIALWSGNHPGSVISLLNYKMGLFRWNQGSTFCIPNVNLKMLQKMKGDGLSKDKGDDSTHYD